MDQTPHFLDSKVRNEEHIIRRTVELMARWDGISDTHVKLDLTVTSAITIRMRRQFSFDEALVLWAQNATPPLTPGQLYRIAQAYQRLARGRAPGADDHAAQLFTRYLQTGDMEHAEEARRAIDQLHRGEHNIR